MRKNKRYVVGYDDDWQCIYGKDKEHIPSWCEPMTLFQAKRRLKKLSGKDGKIYKLVPIPQFVYIK